MDEKIEFPGVGGRLTPIVVGIGASSTALASLELYLSGWAANRGLATVLVVKDLQPPDEMRLQAALQKIDGPSIVPVSNGGLIEGGVVYLASADFVTTLSGGRFSCHAADADGPEGNTIDGFLDSLADDQAENAVGVVLAGTGGDGARGVAAVKRQGGLTIAEQVFDQAAIYRTDNGKVDGSADLVLPASEIARHVDIYVRHIRRTQDYRDFDEALAATEHSLRRITDMLLTRTGHDFGGYKTNTFLRRIQRRMHAVQADSIESYAEFLWADKSEAHNLLDDLLVSVTQFFRDRKEFNVLEAEIIPALFRDNPPGRPVRVWVAGCATGEEAYSIGILLREYMACLELPPLAQIFATDIDGHALAAARIGRYPSSIEADISPERLARWFTKEGGAYTVIKELREMCIFSQHNVIKDAPFSKLDLIACRNVLIYLNADMQDRLIPLFHFGLLPDRYLFLGNSENVSRHSKLFTPVARPARIFRRRETATRDLPEFPIASSVSRIAFEPRQSSGRQADEGLERLARRLVEHYAPAYVITDERLQVLHFSDRTGRYLEPAAGEATLDLLSLVHRDLRLELRGAVSKALESGEAAAAEQVQLRVDENRLLVDIAVEPIQEQPTGARNLVVIFKDLQAVRQNSLQAGTLVRSEHVERLEGELRATRERLNATIEELESTNEELKSSNEEYQSLNEELQSANQELETSREELQSINEELTTVNGELAHRVQELTRATSDLKTIFQNIQIATVFLDNDLRLMNFTPAATQILDLSDIDIGRPISHITSIPPEIYDHARHVIRTLGSLERELTGPVSGLRHLVRILPYRSADNFIAGVIITMTDITAALGAEERQRLLLADFQHRIGNTFGLVRAIVGGTADGDGSVKADHLDDRLNALARAQDMVLRDPNGGVDLAILIASALRPYDDFVGGRTSLAGPSVKLQAEAAAPLALAIHELATNAARYGSLSVERGSVRITWEIAATAHGTTLSLHWEEQDGPELREAPQKRGFGSKLLERSLADQLQAKAILRFLREGFACVIELPLKDNVASTR